jgi:hypothetical protein
MTGEKAGKIILIKTTSFFLYLFLPLLQCHAQDINLFKGRPVIPYLTPNAKKEADSIKISLLQQLRDDDLKKRSLSLDFFNVMNSIAEPSTISFYGLDYTHNSDKIYQKKPFVLNADVQVPISIGGKKWGMKTLQLIPKFKVRILQNDNQKGDSSLPVRTPSYIPGGYFYWSIPSLWKRNDSTQKLDGWFAGIHIFHHSNGQDGNEFTPDGKINFYNGNFSELIVGELLIGHISEYYSKKTVPTSRGNTKLDSTGKVRPRSRTIQTGLKNPNRIFYWRLGFEWHERKHMTNESFRKYNLYGRNRINFQLGYSKIPTYVDIILNSSGTAYYAVTPSQSKESWRLIFNANYIADFTYNTGNENFQKKVGVLNFAKRLNIYGTAYRRIPGAPYAAIFFEAGYYGSDPYNIYFQQSFWQARAGLALAFFKYPKSGDLQQSVDLK